MAAPITWRNVEAPSQRDAMIGFDRAANQVNNSFDIFNGLLQKTEANDAKNVGIVQDNQKQAFLDMLSQAKTPEELAALQQSGAIDQARMALAPAQRAAVRDADEARLTSLRTQNTAGQVYDAAQLEHLAAPIREQIALTMVSDPARGTEMARQALIDNPRMKGGAELVQKAAERAQALKTQANADEDRTRLKTVTQPLTDERNNIEMDALRQSTADAAKSRNFALAGDSLASAYRTDMAKNQTILSTEADKIGDALGFVIPRNTDRSVNTDRMTPQQKADFDEYLTANKLPTVSTIESGNTAALTAARNKLISTMNPSAADLAKWDANAPSAFGTSPTAAIGVDADTIARNNRIATAKEEDAARRFPEIATPGTQDDLRQAAQEIIGQTTNKGTWREENYRIGVQKFIENDGIIVTDDKGDPIKDSNNNTIRVLPNKRQMAGIIAGIDQGMFKIGGEKEITKALKAWKENPENIKAARELYNAEAVKTLRGIDKPSVASKK